MALVEILILSFLLVMIQLTIPMLIELLTKNTNLKYGAPTDISFPLITSTKSGHNVPNKIVAAEAHKKILLSNKPPSLDTKFSLALFSILSYFSAYKTKDAAVTKNKKLKI